MGATVQAHAHACTDVMSGLLGVPKHMMGSPYYYYHWDPGAPFPRGPQNFMTPACREFHKFLASCIFDKLYRTANSCSSLRPIARFAEELQRFVCDRTTPLLIEKLPSKGVAMHAYGISVYYAYTQSQLNGPGWSHSKCTQRSSESQISPSITRAASSSMPKKLKG